jgi:hypothetical protein
MNNYVVVPFLSVCTAVGGSQFSQRSATYLYISASGEQNIHWISCHSESLMFPKRLEDKFMNVQIRRGFWA